MLLLVRCLVLGLRALLAKRRLDLALENVALRHQGGSSGAPYSAG